MTLPPAGTREAEPRAVIGRTGESAILGCDLLKPDEATPPLYVIEWVRFGFLLPIFIKFGLYSPRVDPEYVGESASLPTLPFIIIINFILHLHDKMVSKGFTSEKKINYTIHTLIEI